MTQEERRKENRFDKDWKYRELRSNAWQFWNMLIDVIWEFGVTSIFSREEGTKCLKWRRQQDFHFLSE